MADDLDVEELLEAPYKKEDHRKSSENGIDANERKLKSSKKKRRSRSRERDDEKEKRSRDKEKKSKERRSRSRERSRSRRRHSTSRRKRSRSRDKRSLSRERRRSRDRRRDRRSRSHERRKSSDRKIRSPSPRRRRRSPSPIREELEILTPEERDQRTVFCMQLSQRVRARDLEEFFSAVGKIRDVRLISDTKTGRSKGIAYVEFANLEAVPLALGLSGQKLLGVPIVVQPTNAEKNRIAAANSASMRQGMTGPMRLYVGSLHFNITEDMLRGIFEPFGKIDSIQLMMDSETGRSKGYGFITFHNAEDAKKALEQLNGFELAGRPMKVGHVTERTDTSLGPSLLDNDELDRTGIDLGATGRLQLMAKLAEGTGMEIPAAATAALQMAPLIPQQQVAPPIATQCFMLSNMFDPSSEINPSWSEEIKDDVIEECNRNGGCVHVYVDKASPQGNVYVKCPSISAAVQAVNALHGRWFAGKVITAAYVPVLNYHNLFPDAMVATQLLYPRSRRV